MLRWLLACNGADPDWDVYPLLSYALADLPGPRLVVHVTPSEFTMTLEGDLPCPIPISRAVGGTAGGVPVALRQGAIHGTGLGSACVPTMLVLPRHELLTGDLTLSATDGTTTWTVVLVEPLAERTLTASATAPGGTVTARVLPAGDRWIPDAAGAEPTRLTLTAQQPRPDCVAEHEAPLPAVPGETLELTVPPDFCVGPAYLALSTSARRSAVVSCPAGVECRFDPGGFVTSVEITAP